MQRESGGYSFSYSRRVESSGDVLGIVVVEVDLQKFERAWAGISDAVLVTNSEGTIILSTEPRWRGLMEEDALQRQPPSGAISRALQATADWRALPGDAYFRGEAVMRTQARVLFRGWQMASFTSYASVRERVNGVLALGNHGIRDPACADVLLFEPQDRGAHGPVSARVGRLRQLNMRLQREVAERRRCKRHLQWPNKPLRKFQTCALGEMSAAVSHELNQPLAAMKTYLAGAKLLVGRGRPDEALASFQRIDDLIGRMGAITRQLKSYARKSGDDFAPVNLGDALASSLSMMEPQLRQRQVEINKAVPQEPVVVMADRSALSR